MSVTPAGVPATVVENTKMALVFATFTSTDPAPQKPAHYSAKITFGDGTKGTGKITFDGTTFSVTAAHKYKKQGIYTFQVAIRDKVDKTNTDAGSTVSVTSASGTPFTEVSTNFAPILEHAYGGTFQKSGLNYTNGTVTATRIPDNQDEIYPQSASIISARALAALSTVAETFGFFPGTSGGSFDALFDVVGKNYNVTGQSGPVTMSGPYRLGRTGNGNTFSSQTADNPDGRDHLITYEITGLPGQQAGTRTFVLFWEDTLSSFSDFDYNDMVIELTTAAF